MAQNTNISFSDLPERDLAARRQLEERKATLETIKKDRNNTLPESEEEELKAVTAVLEALEKSKADPQEVANPLFIGIRDLFNARPEHLGDRRRRVHNFDATGRLQVKTPDAHGAFQDDLDFENVVRIALLYGLLAVDGHGAGPVKAVAADPETGGSRIAAAEGLLKGLRREFYCALGEMDESLELAKKVLSILDEEGDPTGSPRRAGTVRADEFARVVRQLKEQGVRDDEPQLRRRVNEALDTIQAIGTDKPLTDIGIALPDLNDTADYRIQTDNVEAVGSHICGAMLDELKAFAVVDKLVELWQQATLPIGRSPAGEMLYRYWRDTPNRMSEAERRGFYAMTLGQPGGTPGGPVNREFNDLWIRFVSSVSSLVRQKTVDQLLRASIPASIGQQQVRKAARDLAQNLSLHAYGMVVYAAIDLQKQIRSMIDLLGHRDILSAYGARDMWQVIDQVATLELGGARNSARYRTLATCGAIITKWLAQNVERFNSATSLKPVIDLNLVMSVSPVSAGKKATTEPTDYDLVNACELWLADTAVDEGRIEQLAQPREAPMMTSRPVAIPAIAREMLEQAGVPALGLGLGAPRH